MAERLGNYLKGDKVIWAVIVTLSIFSLLAVYSSTGTLAYRYKAGNVAYYVLKHGTFLVLSFAIIYLTHLVPYKYFSRISSLL
jgi:cell division protein FtsW